MTIVRKKLPLTASEEICLRAEARVRKSTSGLKLNLSHDETLERIHELEAHQVSLEMQNEELKIAKNELELSRNTYAELYSFSPIAYFIFDKSGVIQEVNLTGAQLLGIERAQLNEKPFIRFIADTGQKEAFTQHLESVLQQEGIQRCELGLSRADGSIIYAHLKSVVLEKNENIDGFILCSVIDGTAGKQLADDLQKAHDKLEILVDQRTIELTRTNLQLTQEIAERKRAEESLQSAYAEITQLKDWLQAENVYLKHEVARQYNFGEIIGQSQALAQVFLQVEQVASMNATVLLLGETGTGKGMIARAIHSSSVRKDRPLITVNCTTLPASLIESELFGREKGAYTGSDARQVGRFELADNGTIFLDEIGELPLELQCKLLRVIQDGEFERLGSPRTIKTDVRIIAATNRNLEEAISSGRFREDLYYRLNVFPITLPPVRQRKEDIPLLVNYFVAKFNTKIGRKIDSLTKETLKTLQEYHWPGNVRELENVIERAVITSQGKSLQLLDRLDPNRKPGGPAGEKVKALVDLEQDHILKVLQKTSWRIEGKSGAAGILGLNASTLRARMRKYGITRQQKQAFSPA